MQPMLIGSVLYGADAIVAAFVEQHIPAMRDNGLRFASYKALGIVGDGGLTGGVVFSRYRGHDIEVSGAIVPGFRCSPAALRAILAYPFGQLGCARLSMTIARKNKPARAFAERLGFRVEGVKRLGADGRQDEIHYGLLRSECRFLREDHGA